MQNKLNLTIKKPIVVTEPPRPKYNIILKKFKEGRINPNRIA